MNTYLRKLDTTAGPHGGAHYYVQTRDAAGVVVSQRPSTEIEWESAPLSRRATV